MEKFDYKKYIKNNPLLKEGITWENRKPGERLPTMKDYLKEDDINENIETLLSPEDLKYYRAHRD